MLWTLLFALVGLAAVAGVVCVLFHRTRRLGLWLLGLAVLGFVATEVAIFASAGDNART